MNDPWLQYMDDPWLQPEADVDVVCNDGFAMNCMHLEKNLG